jgi:transcriptional regulator with XRE-family HTH domain
MIFRLWEVKKMTLEDWSENFSENLLTLLKDRRMSQHELARASGISVGSISSYINKNSLPGIKAVINLAFVLDVDVNELIDFGDVIE